MYLISVVIPCYNEVDSIDILHQKALYITNNYNIEIILLNNGSNDGTVEKLNNLEKNKNIKIINLATNKGYGFGIKKRDRRM